MPQSPRRHLLGRQRRLEPRHHPNLRRPPLRSRSRNPQMAPSPAQIHSPKTPPEPPPPPPRRAPSRAAPPPADPDARKNFPGGTGKLSGLPVANARPAFRASSIRRSWYPNASDGTEFIPPFYEAPSSEPRTARDAVKVLPSLPRAPPTACGGPRTSPEDHS